MTAKTASTTTLSLALRTISMDDCLQAFNELDNNFHLVPDHTQAHTRAQLAGLANAATTAGATSVLDLTSRLLTIIRAVTGVQHPTRMLTTSDSTEVHRTRNLLLVLALAGARSIHADTTALTKTWMVLKPRTGRATRALFDDEIVLLRTTLAVDVDDSPRTDTAAGFSHCSNVDVLTRATAYALAESGMTPGETVSISVDDITEIDGALHVFTMGTDVVKSRVIELDPFATAAVGTLRTLRADNQTWRNSRALTYTPNGTADATKSASVCATQRLTRLLTAAGIRSADNTPSSICKWRYQLTFDTIGLDQAITLSGYTQNSLLSRIVCPAPLASRPDRVDALFSAFA
jgi:integrase